MQSKDIIISQELLKKHGYRVTEGRVALLNFLSSSKKPLSISEIQNTLSHKMDKVTLYRALEDFVSSKIIAKVNLQSTATYYEFIHNDHHHHHIVCEKCGKIEDIENCNQIDLQKEMIKSSKHFSVVSSHSLEFFGVCKMCD
jgi:Fur family ferric uptake transcriptional regulator